MNAFQKRMAEMKTKLAQCAAMRREEERFRALIRQNGLMRTFENAFKDLNGWKVKLRYKNGWYHYRCGLRVREVQMREHELIVYAQMMQAQIHSREMANELETLED